MTIINANYYLEQLLAPAVLERIARLCKFCLRQRAIIVPALLRAMGGDQVNDIAGLHRHFNALKLVNAHQVSYKPFHNQLRKESFALFMKALVERAIALRIDHQLNADMVVKSGKVEYRLIRRWFAEEKRFCLWMTNLPRAAWSAEQVMSLYRCRWQVELLFKEWKSHNRLKGFVTGEKAIAEGLVWTSLLSLVMKRRVAQSVMIGKLSMLKASKNSTTWWLPLLEAVAHRALTEIRERLEWAADYLAKNACRTKQRKSIQNRTLEGVLKGLNA